MRDESNKSRFLLFALTGTVGFGVDGGLLHLICAFSDVGPIMARLVSFPAAVTTTWLLNRHYTFGDRTVRERYQYWSYVIGQTIGGSLNYGTFILLILYDPRLYSWPIVPLVAGSAVGLVFNFLWANYLVFKTTP